MTLTDAFDPTEFIDEDDEFDLRRARRHRGSGGPLSGVVAGHSQSRGCS